MSHAPKNCCTRVYGGSFTGHMCTKSAKIERDGSWYCGIHDPVAKKARDDASMAAWEKDQAMKRAIREAPGKRIKELEADNATLRTALQSHAEEAAKLIQQRDELLAALQYYVANSYELDLGGGDCVAASCESREKAIAAITRATPSTPTTKE